MERELIPGEEEISIPTYIHEHWLQYFNERYGMQDDQPRFAVTLEAEDWLVQRAGEISSAYYELHDALGPHGNYRIIRGAIWNAGITPTPQYVNTSNSPVLALQDAKMVMPNGSENLINENSPDYGLVLVRLDRVKEGLIKVGNL